MRQAGYERLACGQMVEICAAYARSLTELVLDVEVPGRPHGDTTTST